MYAAEDFIMEASKAFIALEQKHAEIIGAVELALSTGGDADFETFERMKRASLDSYIALVSVYQESNACDEDDKDVANAEYELLLERCQYIHELKRLLGFYVCWGPTR
ncbi:MAG: hypothetical protein E7L00_03780 [Propionibacteriaceae bacterium]|nr:hypothetical protein [Propionibacteriaceae bacterium]